MRTLLFLLALLGGCPPTSDDTGETGDTDETGDTADTADTSDTGELTAWPVPDEWSSYGGCRWGALWGIGPEARFDVNFVLPPEDLGAATVSVEVDLADGALKVGWAEGGTGEEWFDVCSDYLESMQGAQWVNEGGRVQVDATLIGEDPKACYTPYVYQGTVTFTDMTMRYAPGSGATAGLGDAGLASFGPFDVALGASECGG